MNKDGMYIQLFRVHGLVRGSNFEFGRNADTGGQTFDIDTTANTKQRKALDLINAIRL